jgi:hypothetical protein
MTSGPSLQAIDPFETLIRSIQMLHPAWSPSWQIIWTHQDHSREIPLHPSLKNHKRLPSRLACLGEDEV